MQWYFKINGDKVYYACYRDPTDLGIDGKPKKKRFKVGLEKDGITQKFVHNTYLNIISKLNQGEMPNCIMIKKDVLTFEQLAALYFENREANDTSETTKNIKNDKSILNNHLIYFFKHNANSITEESINKFKLLKKKNVVLTTAKNKPISTNKKCLSPKTINNILVLLSAILQYGLEQNKISKIPKIKKLTGIDNIRERYFTKEEIELILEKISDNPILSLFLKISLSTGGRLETIGSIKVKDINLLDKTVLLINFKLKSTGKNNTTYHGFLNDQLIPELSSLIKGLSPNSYIFRDASGNRISTDYFQNHLQPLFNELFNIGLDNSDAKNRAVIHTLRHTFATQLAKNGEHVLTIQTLMDHSDIKSTLRYTKFDPKNGKNAVDCLNLF